MTEDVGHVNSETQYLDQMRLSSVYDASTSSETAAFQVITK